MDLESSRPARQLDQLALESTVRKAVLGRGDCDGHLTLDGIGGDYSVGVDVQNGRVCWSASLPREDGSSLTTHYGRIEL